MSMTKEIFYYQKKKKTNKVSTFEILFSQGVQGAKIYRI